MPPPFSFCIPQCGVLIKGLQLNLLASKAPNGEPVALNNPVVLASPSSARDLTLGLELGLQVQLVGSQQVMTWLLG